MEITDATFNITGIPNYSNKKGPLKFIEEMSLYRGREMKGTFAICPSDKLIDIGPLAIDLWRYLKTKLWNEWDFRTVPPILYRDKYFCYYTNSKYKPKPIHFERYKDFISPESIAKDLRRININLEKLKDYTLKEKVKKGCNFMKYNK